MKLKISRKGTLLEGVESHIRVDAVYRAFNEKVKTESYHFLKTLNMDDVFNEVYKLKDFVKQFDVMLHIGIGGSGLAPLVINDMFFHMNQKRLIVVENLDERWLKDTLSTINPERTCLHVVSKSGNTVETIANFLAIYRWMRERLSERDVLNRTVITTNPESGYLNELASKKSLKKLMIPGELTGRFSAISPVALFPSLFIGLEPSLLLKGAKQLVEEFKSFEPHPVVLLAERVINMYQDGKDVVVFMPYSERLQTFSRWFVQLWAESLGKDGKGQTPVPAKGVTDQHTLLQLIMDGPKDKMVMVMKLQNEGSEFKISEIDRIEPPDYLNGITLTDLKEAEYYGTVQSMRNRGVPVIEIEVEEINEEVAGKLFIFFETLVSLVGEAMGINPFDQPAVEEGKKLAREYLRGRKDV